MDKDNIVLVGFMGSGKSTVGKLLAEQLSWDFVDTDHEVARSAGESIPDIFASRGEACFRQLESDTLRRLLSKSRQVISTGGGSVLEESNRSLMLERGYVIALDASVDAIVKRVGQAEDRPLLQGNARGKVMELLEKRKNAYDFAHCRLKTDDLSAHEAAAQIMVLLKDAGAKHI